MEKHGGVGEGAAGYEMKVTGVFGGDATVKETGSRGSTHPARPGS